MLPGDLEQEGCHQLAVERLGRARAEAVVPEALAVPPVLNAARGVTPPLSSRGCVSATEGAGHQDAAIARASLGEDGLQVVLDRVLGDVQQLDAAVKDLINAYHRCDLPKVWGSGTSAAADGTKYDLAENSLLAEYSIRYGGYGGIAYHYVADTYVALFSHFIPCGVWEAIYILEGLLRNNLGRPADHRTW